jgi:hypothetical protein
LSDLDGESDGSSAGGVDFVDEGQLELLAKDEAGAGDQRPERQTFLQKMEDVALSSCKSICG